MYLADCFSITAQQQVDDSRAVPDVCKAHQQLHLRDGHSELISVLPYRKCSRAQHNLLDERNKVFLLCDAEWLVPAIIIVEQINVYLGETVITTVITRQYTVQMVVTNRNLPIRRCYDPTIIMAGTVCMTFSSSELHTL